MGEIHSRVPERALATDTDRLAGLFGDTGDLLPLWIAEPYVDLAQPIRDVLTDRARAGWYGYESRPESIIDAFWDWMEERHGWDRTDLATSVSPSVGTSIGVLLEHLTKPGEGVILQPPVFTDFKPLVAAAGRSMVRNPLLLSDGRYEMDFAALEQLASEANNTAMILCNPHNPVGRLWSEDELSLAARICAANDVFVIADEIHADLVLPGKRFTPFATVAGESGVRWAATHGPIKTFGLAGVCDTLLITDGEDVTTAFRKQSSRLHLTRNNVFALAAFETAYRDGGDWLDGFLAQVSDNFAVLAERLPEPIKLIEPEATYLAWLDLRGLGLDVPDLASWLGSAGLALSLGHWFGRAGAGFARMTVAADRADVVSAVDRMVAALDAGSAN